MRRHEERDSQRADGTHFLFVLTYSQTLDRSLLSGRVSANGTEEADRV